MEKKDYLKISKKRWAIADAAGKTSAFFLISSVCLALVGLGFAIGCDRGIKKANANNDKK